MPLAVKPTVQLVDVDRLQPWDRNPRSITAERFAALKRSLELEPVHLAARPLIALPDGRVVAGNMRQRAAAQLKDENSARFLKAYPGGKVPTFVVKLDEDRATQWAIRDNSPYGEWDEQLQAELLYELEQRGADLDLTGLERTVQTRLIDSVAGLARPNNWPDEPAPDKPKKAKSKAGQIYELGEHRLMCGDSTKPEHVKRLLDGATPKLMVTDPPYGVGLDMSWRRGEQRRRGGKTKTSTPAGYGTAGDAGGRLDMPGTNPRAARANIGDDRRVDWSAAYELVPSLKVCYVWCADAYLDTVMVGLKRIGYGISQLIIWDKLQFVLGRAHYQWQHETAVYAFLVGEEVPWYGPSHATAVYAKKPNAPWLGDANQSTVWQAPSPKRAGKALDAADEPEDHPTQKPTLLWTRPFKNHAQRGDVVYEPFAGSGTALIAAELTDRRCLAMELDPGFCDVIRQRYADYVNEPGLAP